MLDSKAEIHCLTYILKTVANAYSKRSVLFYVTQSVSGRDYQVEFGTD